MDPIQRAKVSNYLVKKLGAGEYASAYLSLPKSVADRCISDYSSGHQSKAATLAKLRAMLQVIKISNPKAADQNTADIDQEVEVLTYLQSTHRHPNIVELVSADTTTDERKRWYTMLPVCRGGNIEQFCHEDFQGQLPAGLVWHIAYQVVSVLLYLHYGSYEASTNARTDWPSISHGDINPGNILFHFPSHASPARTGNYPNLVLIDFGKSTFIKNETQSPPSPGASKPSANSTTPTKPTSTTSPPPSSPRPLDHKKTIQTTRTGDQTNTLYWLTSLEQSLSNDDSVHESDSDGSDDSDNRQDDTENQDGPYGRALKELQGIEKRRSRDVYNALREFQKLAADMRGKLYEDLDEDLLEFFGAYQEDATDEELESVLPVLKKK